MEQPARTRLSTAFVQADCFRFSIDPEHLHHLIAEVIDDLHRDPSRLWLVDPKRDADGLSVSIHSEPAAADLWLDSFSRSFGADTLHTGRIRNIDRELDVGQDEDDTELYPDHAIIIGLPFTDDDPERAESLASRLVEISRTFDRTMRRK